jgi:hypothetical protein
MYMHPIANPTRSIDFEHAMKSAHERAAYVRQHSAVAAIQRQAAERPESKQSSG